ncbi:MAG: 4Fe-4S binding protein [Epsilonproteobacteria bacterium]|nr:4Fe-4S binding protein [Campylobacterota bacterium]
MAGLTFIQKNELFSYSGTNCVRNDYFHNDCHLCVDICPKDAIKVVRNRITLFGNECINCAACMGSCPTEALSLEGFDTNAFVKDLPHKENPFISCKKESVCLGAYDVHHYITMGLSCTSTITCDLAHCGDCALNQDKKVEEFIRGEIARANDFLAACEIEKQIQLQEEKPEEENSKRALFRKAITKAKDTIEKGDEEVEKSSLTMTKDYQKSTSFDGLPLKFALLKEALRSHMPNITKTSHATNFGIFAQKQIVFESCTNCGECVQFCPTAALTSTSDKQGINFNAGNCIACGICDHICKPNAISSAEGIDLVKVAYNRAENLVHYDMVMCQECRCPYPYRGGDPICDRCADYRKDFAHIFTLAKDM